MSSIEAATTMFTAADMLLAGAIVSSFIYLIGVQRSNRIAMEKAIGRIEAENAQALGEIDRKLAKIEGYLKAKSEDDKI